jgi:DsbC/DsbD-like thiol-disulfide interchange protein
MPHFSANSRSPLAMAALAGALTLALGAAPAVAQQSLAPQSLPQGAESPWSPSPKSRARLIAAGGLKDGAYLAGAEIALDGKALTYWRTPGDAGVPPEFDFSKSENVAAVEVVYPAPERHDEGGAEAFGWRQKVIFPLKVRPRDPARPVNLALTVNYGACEKICIPSEGTMTLVLTPGAEGSAHAARIEPWLARAPGPAAQAGIAFALEPLANTKRPAWRVRVTPEPGPGADLFAEGAGGDYFDTKRMGADFKLLLAERAPAASGPTKVRLTLTRGERQGERQGERPVEHETKLDVAPGAP